VYVALNAGAQSAVVASRRPRFQGYASETLSWAPAAGNSGYDLFRDGCKGFERGCWGCVRPNSPVTPGTHTLASVATFAVTTSGNHSNDSYHLTTTAVPATAYRPPPPSTDQHAYPRTFIISSNTNIDQLSGTRLGCLASRWMRRQYRPMCGRTRRRQCGRGVNVTEYHLSRATELKLSGFCRAKCGLRLPLAQLTLLTDSAAKRMWGRSRCLGRLLRHAPQRRRHA